MSICKVLFVLIRGFFISQSNLILENLVPRPICGGLRSSNRYLDAEGRHNQSPTSGCLFHPMAEEIASDTYEELKVKYYNPCCHKFFLRHPISVVLIMDRSNNAQKKRRHRQLCKLIVGLSPYCDVPLYTLPRIVL